MLLALSLSACAIYFHFYFCLFTVNNWWTCEQSVIALLFFLPPSFLFFILKFNSIQLECCCYSAILSCVILILFKCFFVFQLLLSILPDCEDNKTKATITSREMCSWVERSSSLSFFLFFFSNCSQQHRHWTDLSGRTRLLHFKKKPSTKGTWRRQFIHYLADDQSLDEREKRKKFWTNPFKEKNKKDLL